MMDAEIYRLLKDGMSPARVVDRGAYRNAWTAADVRRVASRMPKPVPADTPPADQPLLTVAEVAAALRVSKMTAYRLVNDGALKGLRIGRTIRVRREALEAYIESVTL